MTRIRIHAIVWLLLCCSMGIHAAIIKVGDILTITVLQHPEFSGTYVVSATGTIEHPMASDEAVTDVTTAELARDITMRLAKYVDNPFVTITVSQNTDITVTVLGQVLKPGSIKTARGASLQEALVFAGGPTKGADLSRVKVLAAGKPDGDARFYNLVAFMDSGMIDQMPALQDGDRVIVLATRASTKVKVIGAVNKPGFYELEEKMNVFEIIYLCGGPAEKADLTRVRRLSKVDGKTMEEVVNLQHFIDKGAMDKIPSVNEGDVIIVYSKWFDWKALLAVLNNTLLFIVTIQAFTGLVK